MLSVEFSNPFRGMNIVPRFPGIVFNSKVLPFHQIPELPVDDLAIQDFLYHPFFFTVDNLWEWWKRETSPCNRVSRGWCKFNHIKDRMEAFHGHGKFESVGIISDSSFNWEWTQVPMRHFLGWPVGLNVTGI
jgi:hypothetical protein